MECDLNGFQSIRYVNGHVDILYSYNVSFAVQYSYSVFIQEDQLEELAMELCTYTHNVP